MTKFKLKIVVFTVATILIIGLPLYGLLSLNNGYTEIVPIKAVGYLYIGEKVESEQLNTNGGSILVKNEDVDNYLTEENYKDYTDNAYYTSNIENGTAIKITDIAVHQ